MDCYRCCRFGPSRFQSGRRLWDRRTGADRKKNSFPGCRRCGNRDQVGADAMPDRSHTESDGPISRILPDWSITIVHELVAVVFKFLAEEIQHRPTFMTG